MFKDTDAKEDSVQIYRTRGVNRSLSQVECPRVAPELFRDTAWSSSTHGLTDH